MIPADISNHLIHWSEDIDENSIGVADLWSALRETSLGANAADCWLSIEQEFALQLISIEVMDRLVPARELRDLLDRVEPFIRTAVTRAHWRALRMIAGEPRTDVESMFWRDFLDDDILLSSRARAVVGPAVELGDEKYISRLEQLYDELKTNDSARTRIENNAAASSTGRRAKRERRWLKCRRCSKGFLVFAPLARAGD